MIYKGYKAAHKEYKRASGVELERMKRGKEKKI